MEPSRIVHCEDALAWLENYRSGSGVSLVSSLPDFSEFPSLTLPAWKEWFVQTAGLILSRTPADGVTIFYQSDIKVEGRWVDKAFLCQRAAEALGHDLLWHKIVCRSPAGIATFGRPSYSHLLCFSKERRLDIARSTPDVLPQIGEKTWQRGMGLEACVLIAKFLREEVGSHTLVNPFCGEGSMLAAAEAFGLAGVGIERSPKRAEKARHLTLAADLKSWL